MSRSAHPYLAISRHCPRRPPPCHHALSEFRRSAFGLGRLLYARHGQSLHIKCVDKAERAVIDTIQSSNVPKTCNTEGAAAINLAFGGNISSRARAVLDAVDDVEATADEAPAPTPDLSPLAGNALGRRVLVPQSIYPTEQCDENEGRGWTARVVNYRGGVATTRFVHAATPRGIPYEDVLLRVDVLVPM